MKIKNSEIVSMLKVLSSFGNKKLPQKISYAITKNNIIISKEYKYYSEALEKIISNYSEYTEKDSNGNPLLQPSGLPKILEEYNDVFNNEVIELLNIETDVNLYIIDENCFDYDDAIGKYDVLSPIEIIQLQQVLCKGDSDD